MAAARPSAEQPTACPRLAIAARIAARRCRAQLPTRWRRPRVTAPSPVSAATSSTSALASCEPTILSAGCLSKVTSPSAYRIAAACLPNMSRRRSGYSVVTTGMPACSSSSRLNANARPAPSTVVRSAAFDPSRFPNSPRLLREPRTPTTSTAEPLSARPVGSSALPDGARTTISNVPPEVVRLSLSKLSCRLS